MSQICILEFGDDGRKKKSIVRCSPLPQTCNASHFRRNRTRTVAECTTMKKERPKRTKLLFFNVKCKCNVNVNVNANFWRTCRCRGHGFLSALFIYSINTIFNLQGFWPSNTTPSPHLRLNCYLHIYTFSLLLQY